MTAERDEFDTAWDEEDPQDAAEQDEPTTQAEQEDDPAAEEENQRVSDGEQEGGDPEQDAAEGEDEPAGEEGGDDTEEDPEELKRELEKLRERENKMKSWEGRLSALHRENEELKRRLQEAGGQGGPAQPDTATQGTAGAQQTGNEGGDGPDSDTGSQDDDLRARVKEEYGEEIAEWVDKRAQEIAEQAVGRVDQRIAPLEQARQEAQAAQHQQAILSEHPDAAEIHQSPEFGEWLDSLPSYAASAARQVVEQGSAQEVNELLSQYKASKQPEPSEAQKPAGASKARAVKSRSSGPPKARPTNDFDAAWEEF